MHKLEHGLLHWQLQDDWLSRERGVLVRDPHRYHSLRRHGRATQRQVTLDTHRHIPSLTTDTILSLSLSLSVSVYLSLCSGKVVARPRPARPLELSGVRWRHCGRIKGFRGGSNADGRRQSREVQVVQTRRERVWGLAPADSQKPADAPD